MSAPRPAYRSSRTRRRLLFLGRASAEQASTLLSPARRQRPLQPLQQQRLICSALQNRLENVGCQQGQSQDPAHVALGDVLCGADLADRAVDAVIEQPLPPPRPGNRLDQLALGLRLEVCTMSVPSVADNATPGLDRARYGIR
jgi:hypothetical protein